METLKFTPPVMDYVAVLPQVILVATALIILVIGVFKEWAKAAFIGRVALLGSVLALVSVIFTGSAGSPFSSFGGMVLTDRFSFFH